VARAGDWIDEQVARVTNQSVSRVTTFKETSLNLKKPESSMNKTEQALSIYYKHLIEYVLEQIKKELMKNPPQLEEPFPIVISGGTANPSGFIERFREILEKTDFPLPVKEVRLAPYPLYATAKGALIAAIADREKSI